MDLPPTLRGDGGLQVGSAATIMLVGVRRDRGSARGTLLPRR
jgi:hypothetical protein